MTKCPVTIQPFKDLKDVAWCVLTSHAKEAAPVQVQGVEDLR